MDEKARTNYILSTKTHFKYKNKKMQEKLKHTLKLSNIV